MTAICSLLLSLINRNYVVNTPGNLQMCNKHELVVGHAYMLGIINVYKKFFIKIAFMNLT